jgi:UDP-N-acetylglucosamine 2-epimerase (non-hydrolysing)
MTVFGTRPDTIKMAPVVHALEAAKPAIEHIVCVTAQHRGMLDELLELFAITPHVDLDIMQPNQTLTGITTRVLSGMEQALIEQKPDVVLVHGDTTTSTSAALAAFYAKIPVGHVEAGLRTDTVWEPYPEEMNRRLTGRLAQFHFAPTARAQQNLLLENVPSTNIFVTGNTVIDAFLTTVRRPLSAPPAAFEGLDPGKPWIFVTAHRRENHSAMPEICAAIAELAALPEAPQIIWPVHPSPMVEPVVRALLGDVEGVQLVAPLGYADTVRCIEAARFVLTDSGGLQEEAPCLGRPVLVMRRQTERPEGLEAGTLELVGADRANIVDRATMLLRDEAFYGRMSRANNPYGDGKAAARIVAWLLAHLRHGQMPAPFTVDLNATPDLVRSV